MNKKQRIDFCPNPSCGKGEFIRFSDMELDYREKCSVCGKIVIVPSNMAKPLTMYTYTVHIGNGPYVPHQKQ